MKQNLPRYFSQSFLATIFTVNLCLFFFVSGYIKNLEQNQGDLVFSLLLQSYQTDFLTQVMRFVSFWGYPIPATITTLAIIYWLFLQKKPKFALLFSTVIFADLAGAILKWLVDRPRPTDEYLQIFSTLSSRSFPSNHAIHYTVFLGLVIYLLEKKVLKVSPQISFAIRVFSLSLLSLIGFSRVYLGAHWLSDVIAGYLVGSLFLIGAILVSQKLKIKA